VVRQAVDHHRDAARAVALVADLLVGRAFEVAGAALDRAVHVVLGHALRLRLVDGEAQPGIRCGIASAGARGDRDLADQPREDLTAFRVLSALSELDIGPLAVTGHVTAPSVPLRRLLIPAERRARRDAAANRRAAVRAAAAPAWKTRNSDTHCRSPPAWPRLS